MEIAVPKRNEFMLEIAIAMVRESGSLLYTAFYTLSLLIISIFIEKVTITGKVTDLERNDLISLFVALSQYAFHVLLVNGDGNHSE